MTRNGCPKSRKGADDYLIKPLRSGQCAATIQFALRRAGAANGPTARTHSDQAGQHTVPITLLDSLASASGSGATDLKKDSCDWRLRVETTTPIRQTAWRKTHSDRTQQPHPGQNWLSRKSARSRGAFEREPTQATHVPFRAALEALDGGADDADGDHPEYINIRLAGLSSPMMPTARFIQTRKNAAASARPTAAR